MGEFCLASVLCCENIAATILMPAWKAVKPLHSVVPTELLGSPLLNGLINVFSIIINDKKKVQQKFNILENLIL